MIFDVFRPRFTNEDATIRYAANDHLRAADTWWACNSSRLSPWARINYDLALSRDTRTAQAVYLVFAVSDGGLESPPTCVD
jgi:hypothetical protein